MDTSQIFTKRNIIGLVLLVALAIAIPFAINLLQKQTVLKSKASEAAVNEIKFTGTGVTCDATGKCTSTSDKVDLELRSPWPISATLTPTPTGTR